MKNFKLFLETTSDLAALVGAVVHGNYDRTPRLIVADHLDELGNTSLGALLRLTVQKAEGKLNHVKYSPSYNENENLYQKLFIDTSKELHELGYEIYNYIHGYARITPIGENKNRVYYELRTSGVYHVSVNDDGTLEKYENLPEGVLRAILMIYAMRMWRTTSDTPENKTARIAAIRELRHVNLPGGDVFVDQTQLTDLLIALKDIEVISQQPKLKRTVKDAIQDQLQVTHASCRDTVQENMVPLRLRPLMKQVTDLIYSIFNSLQPKKPVRTLPPMPNYIN